jgi:hypothetical protein
MSNTPRLNRLIFIAYILLCLCVGGAALVSPAVRGLAYAPLRDSILPNFYLNPQAGKAVRLAVVVPPVLEDWAKESGEKFTRQNPLITVNVTAMRGAEANNRLNVITGLPDVWIAESDWTRAAAGGIPYETEGTVVAQDLFVFTIARGSSADILSNLDWRSFARLAESDPQFRLAVPPQGSVEGMGACLSAAAEFFQQNTLTAAQINDPSFRAWLAELLDAVPDLSRNPLDQMVSRPPQADAAFLPGSDGRRLDPSLFVLQTPQYGVVLNFSFYTRTDWKELEEWKAGLQRKAADDFRAFLLKKDAQDGLTAHFLERNNAALQNSARPADASTVYALQFCWSR